MVVLVLWISTIKKIPQKMVTIDTTKDIASRLFSVSVWNGFFFMLRITNPISNKNTTSA